VPSLTDCDDTDAFTYVGAPEACDSIDNDCDGVVDNDAAPVDWYFDSDADGFGDASIAVSSCDPVVGYTRSDADCDDSTATINPDAPELCDGADQNCDGVADDGLGDACACSLLSELQCNTSVVCDSVMGWEWDREPSTCVDDNKGLDDDNDNGRTSGMDWDWEVVDRELFWALDGADLDALATGPGTWVMNLSFDGWLNENGTEFELIYDVDGNNDTCRGWVEPFTINVDVEYTVTVNGAGNPNVNWGNWNWSIDPAQPTITLENCDITQVTNRLNSVGQDIYTDILLNNEFDKRMDDQFNKNEGRYETALLDQWNSDTYLGCSVNCANGLTWLEDPSGGNWGTTSDCLPWGWSPGTQPNVLGADDCP